MIAVTGATGHVGGRVAALLAEAGAPQRLIVRDAARAPRMPGAEVAAASDYGATGEMEAALRGADTLLLIPGREHPDRVAQHRSAVDAAVAAGVRRIVYLSVVKPSPDATFTLARQHWATEEHVRASGVPAWTFVRMNLYLDFLPGMASPEGVIAGPAGDGRVAAVLREDVAAACAAVLTGDGHDGRTHDVTGREAISLGELAEQLTRLTGRPHTYRPETVEEAFASRAGLAERWEVEGWVSSYTAIAAGDFAEVTDTVRELTGHEPGTLADHLRAA